MVPEGRPKPELSSWPVSKTAAPSGLEGEQQHREASIAADCPVFFCQLI